MYNSDAVSFMDTVCVAQHVHFMNSNFDLLGAFQGQRSGVTPQPTLTIVHSFLQLVLLWCTLVMLMSLELEWSSLSEETLLSFQSLQ